MQDDPAATLVETQTIEPMPQSRPAPDDGALSGGLTTAAAAAAAAALLAACGGGGSDAAREAAAAAPAGTTKRALSSPLEGPPTPIDEPPAAALSLRDAARFLAQATMGPKSIDEITALQGTGLSAWIDAQFALPAYDHSAYLESQRGRDTAGRVSEEMSYEAVWQHWLLGRDQLRARTAWALAQIFVISNVAPDIRAVAMSSYMDMLNRNAFGNFRDLLRDVALHPAMGWYLNMLESEKENLSRGTHPNENFAREVMQLFTIGLVKLNANGTPLLDGQGHTQPTYDETVVKGYAQAFTGWSFGGLNNAVAGTFHGNNKNNESYWRVPMIAWQMWHSIGTKQLLDGRVLATGQTAERDMSDALDTLFQHPNVGPFIGRQLIQRLVMSSPSPAYIQRVATVFNDNGLGVRGDMRAVLRAILLDTDAREQASTKFVSTRYGKQREPVLRFAALLRGLGAASTNGRNDIHYLDNPDGALAQSPLLAPSVFNFYSPNYRPAGPLAAAGMTAPEFQITSEISVVGSLNFFNNVFQSSGYGSGNSRMRISYTALAEIARDTTALIDYLDKLFFCAQMSTTTRDRMRSVINAVAANDRTRKVRQALVLTALSPDFVIMK